VVLAACLLQSASQRSFHVLKLLGLERLDRAGIHFVGAHGAGNRERLKPTSWL
jgi:hypothetical protein